MRALPFRSVFAIFPLAAAAALGQPALTSGDVRMRVEFATGEVVATFHRTDGAVRDSLVLPAPSLDGQVQRGFLPGDAPPSTLKNDRLRLELEHLGGDSAALRWTALDGAIHDFEIAIQDNSAYYGCGERFTSLNHKGLILPMASIDRPEDKGAVSYKPVPFYMSTRGYALWVDSFVPGTFDFNATERERVILRYRAARLRLILIDGPSMAEMLNEFTRLTGRPRVPPAWSFAPWKSRNVHHNRDEVLADAELTRKHDLPGSVIVIDSPWETGYNDFVLNEAQFNEPEAMFRRVRELGFYPCLWLTPFINTENVTDMNGIDAGPCRNFGEAAERGLLVRRPDGQPMVVSWWKGRGALVDFTNPQAVAWWQGQIDQTRRWGVRAFKCDDGEGNFVQDAVFHDGTPAAEMKNRYAALYLRAAQEYVDTRMTGDGVLLARCGFTGAQQYPFAWAGDNHAGFSFENGLPTVILAMQNAALSGQAFYGHDIAGYFGKQTKELFVRWTQLGALSPLMQVHMTSNLGPWDFDEETLAVYRTFAKLHTSLYPYLRDAAEEAARRGMPIVRPMVLAFPGDAEAASHRYQYLFGPDLLVAPMYQSGTHRSVYLPRSPGCDRWIDYWTGAGHPAGETLEVHAPLDRMPLFVREGAILCTLPQDVDTLVPRSAEVAPEVVTLNDRRILQLWPGVGQSLLTHDGISATTRREADGKTLTLSSTMPRTVELRRMLVNEEALRKERASQDWAFEKELGFARRRVELSKTPIEIQWSE